MTVLAHPVAVDPLIAEAKHRARRRRLLALAAAGVLLASAAGVELASSSSSGSPGVVPWVPTKPNIGPANPPLAPPCTASQLKGTLTLQGATMSLTGPISLINRSSRPCSLLGRPKLSFANATSKWQETKFSASGVLEFDPLAPPRGSLRALAPGEHVETMLWWSNWCGAGAKQGGTLSQPPAAILLAAPGGGQLRLTNGGGDFDPVCNGGPTSTSYLGATRFTPVEVYPPPSAALPLKARIVSTTWVKGLTGPFLDGHFGRWLSYTVVLTNHTGRVFHFGRACPAYTEGFSPEAHDQAYVLNCHGVGPIGPWKSVRFAMRVWVPRHLYLERHVMDDLPSLFWALATNPDDPKAVADAVVQLH